MAIENRDGVRRLLHRALEDPEAAAGDLADLVAATEHEDRRVRVGAAWAVCAVADARPELGPAVRERLDRRSGPAVELADQWIRRAVLEDSSGAEPSPDAGTAAGTDQQSDPGAASGTGPSSATELPTHPDPATRPDSATRPASSGDESDDGTPDRSRSGGSDDASPAEADAVVRNDRFTIELDRTVFDALEVVERVATDRHSRTYVAMATVDAERRAVLVRTYRPPTGARLSSFASAFDDVLATWDGVDDHEGVLTVHDYGRRPHPWVVTEYASETLRSAGRLPVSAALRVGLDAATALAHARERGVTHRSLDPRSVALDRRDDRPVGRLLNFGIVDAFRAVDGPLPLDSRYAAPELFDDAHGGVDWLTDVYHLGAVLYTAFTGQPPYQESLVGRGGPADVQSVPPSSVADGVPVAADRIVAKSMAIHKIARYESADELARDLRSALDEREDSR